MIWEMMFYTLLWVLPPAAQAAPVCGNIITEAGEACDGTDLGGNTCAAFPGFKSKLLRCKADCSGYDVSQCAKGNQISAASCSQSDVQAAINSASTGDTVLVPAGNCTWTTQTAYTSSVSVTKAIVLKGAGIDQTVIHDGTNIDERPLDINSGARVTGFTFTGMKRLPERGVAEPALGASGTNWRIDHNKFYPNVSPTEPGRGVSVEGAGVIDHNVFIDTKQGAEIYYGTGGGDASWSAPQLLGNAKAVYMEDNTYTYSDPLDGAYDAYDGARYVFRYNTVSGTNVGHHGLDSGGFRSTHSWEIYNNQFNNPNAAIWVVFASRGGSGAVFNNTVTGVYNSFGLLENYRSDDSYETSWGVCNGANPIDGNTQPTSQYYGYPCRDQNGLTTNQALSPAYQWGNVYKGGTGSFWVKGYDDSSNRAAEYHILKDRDYYDNVSKPGYVPYVYPHPLVQLDSGRPAAAPASPGNLRIR